MFYLKGAQLYISPILLDFLLIFANIENLMFAITTSKPTSSCVHSEMTGSYFLRLFVFCFHSFI